MPRQRDYSGLSELEREFEFDMEGGADDLEFEVDGEPEADGDQEYEGGDTDDDEFEFEDAAGDGDESGREREFVERLLELSGREFESSAQVDQSLNEVLDDMEREFFFGALKRGVKRLAKSRVLRSLAKKGLKLGVSKFLPGLQGALQLARGNVKGALLNFGKQALGTVVPGGTATLDAVKAIGLGGGERETWENYVTLSREAYEHLADNVNERADQPAEAVRLGNEAVQHAVRTAKARADGARRSGGASGGRATRVVRLRIAPGERVKLIITGG
jgi:hypothetical protein